MLKFFVVTDRVIMTILKIIIGLLMAGVMSVLFFSVVFRYFLNRPIFWADEVATYSLVLITFLGGYLVLRHGKMVRITFIIDLFPKSVFKIITIVANVVTMVFIALFGYQGMLMTKQRVILIQTTVALRIPMVIFYRLIPIMAVLMIYGLIIETLALFFPDELRLAGSSSQKDVLA